MTPSGPDHSAPGEGSNGCGVWGGGGGAKGCFEGHKKNMSGRGSIIWT